MTVIYNGARLMRLPEVCKNLFIGKSGKHMENTCASNQAYPRRWPVEAGGVAPARRHRPGVRGWPRRARPDGVSENAYP